MMTNSNPLKMAPKKSNSNLRSFIIFTLALTLAVVVVSFIVKARSPRTMSLEEALWVSDWELEAFYAPGSPTQKLIVKQLERSMEVSEFETSEFVLYRMGGRAHSDSIEDILLYGFDPTHPEMAQALKPEKR